MKKETVNKRVDRLRSWISELVEDREKRILTRGEVRDIMVDEMGLVDERAQDRWIGILVRRKHIIPANKPGTLFYIPGKDPLKQQALDAFDIPEIELEVKQRVPGKR